MAVRRYAYGRNPARPTRRGMRSAFIMATALNTLGAPPDASNEYAAKVTAPWNMFGNDTLGDCVAADSAHTLMLRTANVSTIVVPTLDDVIKLYSDVGHYVPGDPNTDNGCEESDMCLYLKTTGFLGHKANAYGNIDPTEIDHIKWCTQLFGSCRLGLNLPAFAEDQFDQNKPWDLNPGGDQSPGGHDVPLVDYRNGLLYCVTWGRLQPVTVPFILKYCEEAHAELYFDWINAQGMTPAGFNLNDLADKLKEIVA